MSDKLELRSIAQNAGQGRWRTEAMRSHASPRLLYFTKGQGRITIAGLTSGYGPNNLIFVPARTLYGYEIGPLVFGQMLTIPQAMAAEWPEDAVHLRLRDVIAQKEITAQFDALERELGSQQSGASRAAHHHLGLLAVQFARLLDRPGDEAMDHRAETAAARLSAAYSDLVERDFRSPKGVAAYARELGVTPTHLTRCCRQTCGRSALAMLNDRKLYEARVLLRSTPTPVKDIAAALGFGSAAYFTRNFQAHTGQTPSGFRRFGATGQSPTRGA